MEKNPQELPVKNAVGKEESFQVSKHLSGSDLSHNSYFIQIGSFRNQQNALRMKEKMQAVGLIQVKKTTMEGIYFF
ncbi:MAG: SPOR domain-containing protein [Proteobacteria bacterium]|nr:SPOR domain-containing protein [Pseudomonadota bacterium]MBU2454379.1 SPOR domain-containing protein [Pseudomonadota bacterium]